MPVDRGQNKMHHDGSAGCEKRVVNKTPVGETGNCMSGL